MALHLHVVAGPTASGKSGLAVALAERLGGHVINADSMQVYADLTVLTAQPGPGFLDRVPHRLYGVLDGADVCSAARWAAMAVAAIEACLADGAVPILCGGSGLYLQTLLDGIAVVPDIPDSVRAAARELHASLGGSGFHRQLALLDPDSAALLHPGDSQRLIRAYEVVTATGLPIRSWQQHATRYLPDDLQPIITLLSPPRADLYRAIDQRFLAMLEQGAVVEVRRLLARGLDPALPIMKALGVPQLARFLEDEISLSAAVEQAQHRSHQYAKRQTTWFRHRLSPHVTFAAQFSERLAQDFCHKITEAA